MNFSYKHRIAVAGLLLGFLLPLPSQAQDQDGGVSLGEIARALRKEKKGEPSAPVVIDNDNLSKVTQDIQKQRQDGKIGFLFDAVGKDIHVSSPDVSCSLAFNADSAALLSDPYVPQDLPLTELGKLDGPAAIHGDSLQVNMHNGTGWTIKEITVSLTILRHTDKKAAAAFGPAQLLPAVAGGGASSDSGASADEKESDFTVLYHLKGLAAPSSTTLFQKDLGATLGPDEDWHWAIVQAQGVPPKPEPATPPTAPLPPAR